MRRLKGDLWHKINTEFESDNAVDAAAAAAASTAAMNVDGGDGDGDDRDVENDPEKQQVHT